MRTLLAGCAVVAMFGLTAARCTPEQVDLVVADYRATVEAATDETRAPEVTSDSVDIPIVTDPPAVASTLRSGVMASGATWSVDADCDGAHIVLTGWTGITDVMDSTGQWYAIVGLGGSAPSALYLDANGNADHYIHADQGTRGTPSWGWGLTINGDPYLDEYGDAAC